MKIGNTEINDNSIKRKYVSSFTPEQAERESQSYNGMAEPKLLFRYVLGSAWSRLFQSIAVYDAKKDNVKTFCEPHDANGINETEQMLTVPMDVIDKIKAVYERNKAVFKIGEVVFPLVLDGTGNDHYFFYNGEENNIEGHNLWAVDDDLLEKADPVQAENTKILFKVHEQIRDVLVAAGVDEKFFTL